MWDSKEQQFAMAPLLLGLVEHSAAVHVSAVSLAHMFRARLGAEVAIVAQGSQHFLEEVVVLLRLHFLRTRWLVEKIYF